MKKILTLLILISFHQQSIAQLVKAWDKTYGGCNAEAIVKILPLENGGILLAGNSYSGADGNKTSSNYGGSDYWIVLLDSTGQKLWDADFGGSADEYLADVIESNDGGFLLGGYSYSGISGTKTQSSWGGSDYWIVKVDFAGQQQWDKRFGTTSEDHCNSICKTSDGCFLAGGMSFGGISGNRTQSSWGGWDYWILKFDSIGNILWDKRFGGISDETLYSLFESPDHSIILAGYSYSGISGDKTQSSWGGSDFWAVKIDSAGNKIWDKRAGTTSYDYMYSACSDGHGGVVMSTTTSSGISGDKSQTNWGGSDYWVIRLNSYGDKVWDKRFGGTSYEDEYGNIYRCTDGGYVIAGTSYSYIGGNKTQANQGSEQTWAVRFDSLGNYIVDRTMLTNGHDEVGKTAALKNGCILVANNTSGGISGDKTSASFCGSYDFFIAKYCVPGPPLAAFNTLDSTVCAGQCITFNDVSYNIPSTWSWTFTGGTPATSTLQNPIICYYTTGTFDVKLIVTNISGTDTIIHPAYISVSPQIFPTISQNGTLLTCIPATTSYQWYFNYISISGATNQTYTGTQTGLYSVMAENSSGCSGISSAFNFNINVCIATFSSGDSAFCQNSCINFFDLSSNTPTTWLWSFEGATPSASSIKNPVNICYNTPGIYNVTLKVTNQYGVSSLVDSSFIQVFSPPVAPSITQSGDTLFSNTVQSFYQWYLDGNEIGGATNSNFYATQFGSYSVKIIDGNGCVATSPAYVFFKLVAGFSVNDSVKCQSSCLNFFDQSLYNPTGWVWGFPGGNPSSSTEQNPQNICYSSAGNYSVTLTISNLFGQNSITNSNFILIVSNPIAPSIIQVDDTLFCSSIANNYQWNFNGNEISGATNQSYIASDYGSYTVSITDSNGCSASSPVFFYFQNLVAGFSVSDSIVCESTCLGFSDLTLNSPTSWLWDFPGGNPSSSTQQNPTNICYNTTGFYPVTLTVANQYGQSSLTYSDFIEIIAYPNSPVIIQVQDTLFCTSIAATYQWYFDGNEINGATNSFYVAPQNGSYSVAISNSIGCSATSSVIIEIPATIFSVDDISLCEKFCTTFNDSSTNNPVSWQWFFEGGAPSTSSIQNPTICFNVPGIFDITLITYNGTKFDTLLKSDYIEVIATPVQPVLTIKGDSLISSDAYQYEWQLGNNFIPGATNKIYVATQSGFYTVITLNQDGCSSQTSINFNLTSASSSPEEGNISVSPNPFDGILSIEFPSTLNEAQATVCDVTGNKLWEGILDDENYGRKNIDLKFLADGIYFLKISSGEKTLTTKIIKQH